MAFGGRRFIKQRNNQLSVRVSGGRYFGEEARLGWSMWGAPSIVWDDDWKNKNENKSIHGLRRPRRTRSWGSGYIVGFPCLRPGGTIKFNRPVVK